MSEVINHRIRAAITYNGFLHGFWVGRGTVTASLEANLLQQLIEMRE